jgi:hypothetical protein
MTRDAGRISRAVGPEWSTSYVRVCHIAAVDDSRRYSGLVRTSAATFPRGGVWLFFFWYAVLLVLVLVTEHPRAWFAGVVAALFVFAPVYLVRTFSKGGAPRFTADETGIRFGGRPGSSAGWREVPWPDVRELRITPARFGARLDVLVSPASPIAYRSSQRQVADLALMAAGIRRSPPAVTVPRRNPARYVIPLVRVTPDELHAVLQRLAPGVPIVVSA